MFSLVFVRTCRKGSLGAGEWALPGETPFGNPGLPKGLWYCTGCGTVRVETMRISFGELACSGKYEHWEVTSWGKGAWWVGKTDASNTYSECIRRALVM